MTTRFDTFIIWGNGLENEEKIISEIRQEKSLEIIKIVRYFPKNISKFVKDVYSVDYVPFEHLKNKTQYLNRTKSEVIIVVVLNKDVNECFVGEGEFKHIECLNVKRIKEKIRNKFNPYEDGKRTEEHVIHATDTEEQADYLLKLIGIVDGLTIFSNEPSSVIKLPYHIQTVSSFSLRLVSMDKIYGNILFGDREKPGKRVVHLDETPHILFLRGKTSYYNEYIKKYGGIYLTDDHFAENFIKLSNSLKYLKPPHDLKFILVDELKNGNYLIEDGLHRAAILCQRDTKEIIVAVRE